MKNKYENLPDGAHQIKFEHVDDVAKLLVDTFLKNNEIWSSADLDSKIMLNFFRKLIIDHIQAQKRAREYAGKECILNMFTVVDGKMRSVILQYEIEQYRLSTQNSKESEIPLFRSLEKIGKQLAKVIDLSSLEKGKHVYSNFGGSDDDMIANKMSLTLLISYMEELQRKGFHSVIYRSTNVKVIKMCEKLGGKLLKEASYQVKGKLYPLFFATIDLRSPVMLSILERWRKQMKKGIFPKL